MERDRRIFRSVRILVAGRSKTVRTVMGAGKLLLEQWPNEDGPARQKAQMAILDAFNEEKSPEEVRQALLDAAAEAHLDYKCGDQAPKAQPITLAPGRMVAPGGEPRLSMVCFTYPSSH